MQEIHSAANRMRARVGVGYMACRLSNFELHGTARQQMDQRAAVFKLRRYCDRMTEEISAGRNIVLFGPPGTGKDHLLTAMMLAAFKHRALVEWTDGVSLFRSIRDSIGGDVREGEILRPFIEADVFAISDPIPPWGSISQFQGGSLFQIIDRRCRNRRPIWVTANFHDGEDAAKRLGIQVLDRLRDRCVEIPCDWNSFRRADRGELVADPR